jgi:hypothetical protein
MQRIWLQKDGTSETVEAKKNILLSTGSKPSNLPLLPSIKKNSLSIEALKLPEVLNICKLVVELLVSSLNTSLFTSWSASFGCRVHGSYHS